MNHKPGISTHGMYQSKLVIPHDPVPAKEYDRRRRKELEKLEANGKLPPELVPELRHLRGERRECDYRYHRKARAQINRLAGDMSLSEIAGQTKSSKSTVASLRNSAAWRNISDASAQSIYYHLKKVEVK